MGGTDVDPVSPEFIQGMVDHARAENAREAAAAAHRLEEAKQEAALLAARLAALPGMRRVILFGSTARERGFRVDSDIDIAIEGRDLLAVMAVVETSAFHVDVVDLARANVHIRQRIESEGVILYEARS
ncbi:MAG TPA: nucleotidyltransferase domain-containing protein [Rectinemataceae bacterium]|nr:nucleotidyltransferase domain-containing protein [Rectinemataceae bacterium]